MARILVGLVGYCQFVRGYVLGPELMARLRAGPWPEKLDIREMNWGPIAIVQDLQAAGERFDRVVLVGACDAGRAPNSVTCRRWTGRTQDPLAVQRRVFEAVTGVISVDNLLVIGAHFGVWPDELFSVEVQMAESCLGDVVLAEIEQRNQSGNAAVIGEQLLTAGGLELVERIVAVTRRVALEGVSAAQETVSLDSDQLRPVAKVCHYDFVEQGPSAGFSIRQEQLQ